MKTLVLTGWGWKEYAVAAAAALEALGGDAEVMGMSKRRLPEFMETEAGDWKRIALVGISLGGDEARLAQALKALKGKTKVVWISALPMSESQKRNIAPLMKVVECEGGPFNGSLVKAVGVAFGTDVSRFLPFAYEGAKIPKSVPPYHELLSAAMFAYRSYQDCESYSRAIECLSRGLPEESWDQELKRLVSHYRLYGHRELVGKSAAMKELRGYIDRIAAHPEARVLVVGESGTGKETVAQQIHAKSSRRNVRELLNLLERAAVLDEHDFKRLVLRHREMNAVFDEESVPTSNTDLLDDMIRGHVRRVLHKYALNVTRAAAALGISRTTLRKWM